MSAASDPRMVAVAHTLARLSSLFVGVAAALALVGWAGNWDALKSIIPGLIAMNPVTALAFLISVAALWILCGIEAGPGWRSRHFANLLALIVLLIGLLRLVGYLMSWQLTLDEWLFRSRLDGNRMAPNTALCFILVALALMSLDVEVGSRRSRPAVWLALLPGSIGLLAIAGYVYGVADFYALRKYIQMALNSAICFVIICAGILCARPGKEPAATLVSRTAGGATARRLLPAALLAPLLLGWLQLKGEEAQWYGAKFGVALAGVVLVGIFVTVVYVSGRSLAKAELRRRVAEDMLAASEAFYHTLVETLPQNIYRKDLQGRFTFANGRFLSEMHRMLDQVVGKTDFDFFPQSLAERYRRDDQAVIRTGTPFETVEEHVKPEGEKIYVQVIKTAVYDDRGGVIGTQGMFWDVTEKKRSEEELERKNRLLEEAAKAEREAREALIKAQGQLVQSEKLAGLGQMVAGVAHEINNPLAFVGNNVAVMQRDVGGIRKLLELYKQADGSVPADLRQRITELEEQIDLNYTLENLEGLFARSREGLRRIQQIVKDLRDFARLDESDLSECDLNAGITSTLNIIQGHAKRKQVRLVTDLAPLPPVTCYPAKINQVIMNLVGNAIDASHDEGEVTIRSRADGANVILEVKDNGTGIPQAIREKIFDPFFTTKPQGEGTGLGLSISYGIVHDHGGEIEVESEVGKGALFRVTLPIKAVKQSPHEQATTIMTTTTE
jgi:PAS domain S-box-containing protein